MIKLLLKLALFFGILLLIKLPFFLSFEDEWTFRQKEFERKEFNAVFIGSSRTRHGILPAYFDFLNQNRTKSYNFGIAASVANQSLDRCEKIINTKPAIKYIFFELSGGIDSIQIYEEPWINFSWREHWQVTRQLSWQKSVLYNERLLINFFKPNLIAGKFDSNLALEEVLDRKKTAPEKLDLREMNAIKLRNLQAEDDSFSKSLPLNQIYWERIENIIKLAESKEIRIYFYIPPQLKTDNELKTIAPIWQKLDEKYKIKAQHFDEALYQSETSNSEHHLKHSGALIFTKDLAEKITQKEQ